MMSPTFHIQDQDLEKYVSERLDSASASHLRSHVLECAACEKRLVDAVVTQLATLSDGQKLRFRETRIPASVSGWLQTLCPLSFEKIKLEIVDTSASGYGIHTAVRLEPGTIVQLDVGPAVLIGTIRYCESLENDTYKAGVQLQGAHKPAH